MSGYLIIPLIIIVFGLIIFLIRQNIKDEKELRNLLNNDYHKFKESDDVDTSRALNE